MTEPLATLEVHARPPAPINLGLNPFCTYAGCGAMATVQVGASINVRRLSDRKSAPFEFMTTFCLCDAHKDIAEIAHLMTPQARAQIAQSLKGDAVADFMSAKIILKPLKGDKPHVAV